MVYRGVDKLNTPLDLIKILLIAKIIDFWGKIVYNI